MLQIELTMNRLNFFHSRMFRRTTDAWKPALLALTLFSGIHTVQGQQDVLTGQYLFNGLLINPAYAGHQGSWETMVMQRIQWVDFDGSPATGILSGHGGLANKEIGVGGTLALDAIGITSTLDLAGHASYHLDLGNSTLSFGLRGGMLQYRARLSEVTGIDPSDPVYQGSEIGAWIPRFGFGMLYEQDTWFVGLSTPTLFVFDQKLDRGISPYYRNHMYFQAGMSVEANGWLELAPSILFRHTPDVPSVLDLNLLATMKEAYTLGLGYRTGSSFVLVTQFRIDQQFRIGYTRDFTTSDIRTYAGGTHEMVLGWDLMGKSRAQPAMPLGW